MERLSIAILGTRGIPASYGGFETFAEELATRLAARGHRVTVYARPRYVDRRITEFRGVRVRVLPTIPTKHLDTVAHAFVTSWHAVLRGYDVALYCNAATAPFLPIVRLFRPRTRVAINVDGIEKRRRKWGLFGRVWYSASERAAGAFAHAVVADARVIAEYWRERRGIEAPVIAYGASTERAPGTREVERLGLASGGYVLYVSRLEPENNALAVVRAFRGVATEKRLVVVGDAPYARAYVERVKREAALDPRVVLPGAIYGLGYRELVSHAAAHVHATEVGGTHPALLEAMAVGHPVLVLDTPENREAGGEAVEYFGWTPRTSATSHPDSPLSSTTRRAQQRSRPRRASASRRSTTGRRSRTRTSGCSRGSCGARRIRSAIDFVGSLSLHSNEEGSANRARAPPAAATVRGDAPMSKSSSIAGSFLILVVAQTGSAQPVPDAPPFESVREYLSAIASADLLLADLTASGRVDVLGYRTHFRSDGSGGFDRQPDPGYVQPVRGVHAIADFDGDGRLEIVGASGSRTSLGIVGIDDGVVVSRGLFSSGTLTALAAADFDGDGDVDIAFGFEPDFPQGQENLRFGVNSGDGTFVFSPPRFPRLIGTAIERLVADDLNGDGTADLIGSDSLEDRTWILFGAGDGSFGEPVRLGSATGRCLATTDFNADGVVDLLTCAGGSRVIEARLGIGDGRFAEPTVITTPTVPTVIEPADVNGDGFVDIVFVDDNVARPRIRTSLYRFDTGDFAPFVETPTTFAAGSLDLVDLDGDGIRDVVVGSSTNGSFRVHLGKSDGHFEDIRRLSVDQPLFGIAVGRFDAGPALDVAYYRATSTEAGVGVLPGDGCFVGPRVAAEAPFAVTGPIVGDFDEDGLDDLVGRSSSGPVVAFGDPSGTFSRRTALPTTSATFSCAIADFDADGNLDVVATEQAGIATFFGDGAGAFGPAVNSGGLLGGLRCVAAEFDGDGITDLVVSVVSRTAVLLGDGLGHFTEHPTLSSGLEAGRLAAADLDSDGRVDLVISNPRPTAVRLQDGVGGFAPPFAPPGPAISGEVLLRDFDADGFIDLLVSRFIAAGVTRYQGDGAGGFGDGESFATGGIVLAIDIADMNNDGQLDVLALDRDEDDVVLLPSASPLARARRGVVNEGSGPRADVVLVNGSAGSNCRRSLRLSPSDPLEITVAAPPAGGGKFALYAWPLRAGADTVRALPQSTGFVALPVPATPGSIQPREIWNNWGREAILGAPTRPSTRAPSRVVLMPGGLGRPATFTVQGIIQDFGAPNGRAAATNAIEVVVR